MAKLDEAERTDDLNTDEQSESTESFPDPVLDEEPADSEESAPPASVEGGLADLPASDLPPSPPLPEPPATLPADQGFTPYTPPRETTPPPAQPQVQFFTTAQLTQAVNEGLITEDQKIDQLQLQNRELAKQEALKAFQQQSINQTISSQLDEYRKVVPGWDQTGSPANVRAAPAFSKLLQRGFLDNDSTRLTALEMTFGTLERIQEARAAQTRTASLRAVPQEVGRRGQPPSSKKAKDPLDTLSIEEKREYQRLINGKTGPYQTWNDVRKEITKYENNKTRARVG